MASARMYFLRDRKSTRLNSSHDQISYAVFCLKKKNKKIHDRNHIDHPSRARSALRVRRVRVGSLVKTAMTPTDCCCSYFSFVFFFFLNNGAPPKSPLFPPPAPLRS